MFYRSGKVVAFDFDKRLWDSDFSEGQITEFWHANKFISTLDSSLYVIGGYGRLKYKKTLYNATLFRQKMVSNYSIRRSFCTTIPGSIRNCSEEGLVYIIGGYGSFTGIRCWTRAINMIAQV